MYQITQDDNAWRIYKVGISKNSLIASVSTEKEAKRIRNVLQGREYWRQRYDRLEEDLWREAQEVGVNVSKWYERDDYSPQKMVKVALMERQAAIEELVAACQGLIDTGYNGYAQVREAMIREESGVKRATEWGEASEKALQRAKRAIENKGRIPEDES